GVSGIHCHMSNTRNTPAEALEYHYPLRVHRNALRDGSGGAGVHPGGAGIVREVELLEDAMVTLLADRRERPPYGACGGGCGAPGHDSLQRPGEPWQSLPEKGSRAAVRGTRLRLETPGGGGWGAPQSSLPPGATSTCRSHSP